MKTLFVAWQDPQSRRWIPVGRLTNRDGLYEFVYTLGAKQSKNFLPFGRMGNLESAYVSDVLFPLFANRVLSKSRPEYKKYLRWIGASESEVNALEILAKSGGMRATDSLQIFPCPEPSSDEKYQVTFFSHGIRHLPPESQKRIETLESGEQLFLLRDIQNPHDGMALMMRTDDPIYTVGYCPRFYSAEFSSLIEYTSERDVRVVVDAVNVDAPLQFRLRCCLMAPWPANFVPCSQDTFRALA